MERHDDEHGDAAQTRDVVEELSLGSCGGGRREDVGQSHVDHESMMSKTPIASTPMKTIASV